MIKKITLIVITGLYLIILLPSCSKKRIKTTEVKMYVGAENKLYKTNKTIYDVKGRIIKKIIVDNSMNIADTTNLFYLENDSLSYIINGADSVVYSYNNNETIIESYGSKKLEMKKNIHYQDGKIVREIIQYSVDGLSFLNRTELTYEYNYFK